MTNKERYRILKEKGICVYCKSAPAEDGKTTCRKCREKQRQQTAEKRAALKELGFCTECGKNRIFGNEKLCPECAARKYISNRKHKDKARENRYSKERREKLKAAGICVMCGKRTAEKGKTRCITCNIREQNRMQKMRNCLPRHERPSYGMCYICGKAIEKGALCDNCKQRVQKNLPETNPNENWRKAENARVKEVFGRKEK